MKAKDRIIVALDVDTVEAALNIILELGDSVGMYKVGLQLITRNGPETFAKIVQKHSNAKFFYDAKFHDIPNTVGAAVKNASDLPGIKFISVHASTGMAALDAAEENKGDATILGITALTSLGPKECGKIFGISQVLGFEEGIRGSVVRKFATMFAGSCPNGGIVCSPNELDDLKDFDNLTKVVPGIRPEWAAKDDQKSISTPGEAIRNGADYLVIGRPIREPPSAIGSPLAAVGNIVSEIEQALDDRV